MTERKKERHTQKSSIFPFHSFCSVGYMSLPYREDNNITYIHIYSNFNAHFN